MSAHDREQLEQWGQMGVDQFCKLAPEGVSDRFSMFASLGAEGQLLSLTATVTETTAATSVLTQL